MENSDKQPLDFQNIDRMIDYSTGIANEFSARLNRIRSFITEHNLTSGTANEMILRNFLAEFSTGRNAVGQGFICHPAIPNQRSKHYVSKQCDILVYNRDYPLVHSEGDVKVVWPQSVQLLIEVKTQLRKQDLKDALANISAAKKVPYMRSTPGILFAFHSSKVKTIVKHLREYNESKLFVDFYPEAILLLDEGIIIHRWLPARSEITEVYQVRKGQNNEKAVVMAFLMMFFFDIVMGNLVGGSEIVNMLSRMLEYRTYKIEDDFKIGDKS